MDETASYVTMNIRGLGGKQKSKSVLDWLRNNSKGVTFLQETHSNTELAEKWKNYWKGEIYCSHGTTNSKGVAILFHQKLSHEILDTFEDRNGRYLIMRVKVFNEIIILTNCYLPTKDHEREQCSVLKEIVNILSNFPDDNHIIGGDFNVALNPILERHGGRIDANESKRIRQEINGILIAFNLEDIVRNRFPDKNIYTWHNKTKGISSRLDYWFISESLLNRVKGCVVQTALYTDHDLVRFTLQLTEASNRGPGYWKFNSSFISNVEYVAKVKETIQESFDSVKHYDDKSFIWDYIKMQLRKMSIEFSKHYVAQQRRQENFLNRRLALLQQQYNLRNETVVLEDISVLKKELENIQTTKTNGAIIRSKVKDIEQGERNTAYFLSIEKNRGEIKSITHLRQADNSIAHGKESILKEIFTFYKTLYTETPLEEDFDDETFLHNNNVTLSDHERNLCEGLITERECLSALKQLKNGKTPGIDGLSADFYKFFWSDIKQLVLASINHAMVTNQLSLDQRRGLISLVPKKDKDRLLLKNWRPIALLTTDYKLIAKCLAMRITKVIDKLIAPDQTGYIKGRYIGENIRTVHDIIDYLNDRNKGGILMLIDFEKAFDTVRWKFIDKTLKAFNFGASYRAWVKILYNNIQSAVLNNGHLTSFFYPERGVRQGCPLSVYLFILVAELLAISIRANRDIEGISLTKLEVKISQLADDTSLFISKPASIDPIFKTLKDFSKCSGLKVNVEKTKIYNIGSTNFTPEEMNGYAFAKDEIELLGITISIDKRKSVEKNFVPKIRAIENILKQWSRRKLSLKGKITIVNALALSMIVYPASVLETPAYVLEEINNLLMLFMWDGKRPKIAAKILENSIELGGLKMPNIFLKVKAWQLSWLQRAIIKPLNNWVSVVNELLKDITLQHLVHCGLQKDHKLLQNLPTFYKEIITTWFELKEKYTDPTDKAYESLWYNKNVKVDGNPIFWNQWYIKGVFFIKDIIQENGDFMSIDTLYNIYGIHTNFLALLQIKNAIPYQWRQSLKASKIHYLTAGRNDIDLKYKFIPIPFTKHKSFRLYQMLLKIKQEKYDTEPKCIQKWEQSFHFNPLEWKDIFIRPYVVCKSTIIQSFQYRLLHRVITCNHWLFNASLKESPDCEVCGLDDTLQHFFIECNLVQNFWNNLTTWWATKDPTHTPLILTHKEKLFGKSIREYKAYNINLILFHANKFIHDRKMCAKLEVSFAAFLITLKRHLDYEKIICIKNNDYNSFNTNWLWLYDQMF